MSTTTYVEHERTGQSATLPIYHHPDESQHELDWADLVTLDLSKFDQPGGKQELAAQLREAVHNVGFFYITNFGLSQESIDRQYAIGKSIFDLPEDEKLKYRADLESGNYNGYRPKGVIELAPGLYDSIEMYNIFKFIPELERSHPSILLEHREEVERFQRFIAQNVVEKLLRLIAIILEVPEDALLEGHRYDRVSDCALRYMVYRARTPEDNQRYEDLYLRGHTDFGSMTLLFRQPIAALQVRMSNGSWKWVKPYPGSITVNIADALQFWTNGYLKSSIHRVVAPPQDQAHLDRLGLLYFVRPAHDLSLKTLDSPLLQRLGLAGEAEAADIKAGDWVRKRVANNALPFKEEADHNVLGNLKAQRYD
ncbi:Non-heme dioxygenase in morphine synthesis N-terminal-containing protein 2 [Elsinoe fawcettii]|nr:Non-heme dioxygenase in morphine synthesis N-terminal-containing protein 2 [Elsinoe fawcettii]